MTTLAPSLPEVLGALPTEAWIVRPDGHIAAVLDRPSPLAVRTAIERTLAHATTVRQPAPIRAS